MIVAKLTLCIDAAGTTIDYLCCNGVGFTTLNTDTPAATFIEGSLTSAGRFEVEMFSGDRVTGGTRSSHGGIVIGNADGRLDVWRGYAVGGRNIEMWIGEEGGAFPSDFTLARSAVMSHFVMSMDSVEVVLRDRMEDFNKPMCTQVYAGTGGLEGDAALAGRRKPKGYGYVFNAKPVLVVASLLLYQMSSSYETSTLDQYVKDGGSIVDNDVPYSTLTELLSGAYPIEGAVRHYAPAGCFRLGSASVFECTADRKFHDTVTSISSKLIERMALDAGVSAGDIDTVSLLGFTAGYYSEGDETTFMEAMVRIAGGAGLYFGWNRLGKLSIGQLVDPASLASAATLTDQHIYSIERRLPSGMESPTKAVRLNFMKNWSPMSTLSGEVTSAFAEMLRGRGFTAHASDSTISTKHPYAGDLERDSYSANLSSWLPPSGEADRVLALFKTERELFDVEVEMDETTVTHDIGTVLTLKLSRMGLSAGKKFVVTRMALDYDKPSVTFGLWG